MAKRFTDTGKYRKAWFRRLPTRLKCAWDFLTLECDSAGVWEIDLDAMQFYIGEAFTLSELETNFDVTLIGDNKLWIPGFIDFQYGELHPACKPHIQVINRLKKLNLWEGYLKGFKTLKDKDKDQDKEKDQEKEGSVRGEKTEIPDLVAVWNSDCGTLPKIRSLTDQRRRAWRNRWGETPDLEHWKSVIARLAESPFCRGENSTGWRATVDFLLRPDTATKALEGAYDRSQAGGTKVRSIAEMIDAGEVPL